MKLSDVVKLNTMLVELEERGDPIFDLGELRTYEFDSEEKTERFKYLCTLAYEVGIFIPFEDDFHKLWGWAPDVQNACCKRGIQLVDPTNVVTILDIDI